MTEPLDFTDGEGGDRRPDWRRLVEERCREWLDSLDGEPASGMPEAAPEAPDLYAFYAELCAVRHEFRKQSRRTTDGLARFGGILDEFEEVFGRLRARLERAEEVERQADDLREKRDFFLPLVEVYDRFRRLEKRLADPPPAGIFAGGRRRRAWAEGLRDGFAILEEHFGALLRRSGVEPVATVGRPFDPRTMKVVEVEITDAVPAGRVLAELEAGYLYREQLLRPAAVKVAKG